MTFPSVPASLASAALLAAALGSAPAAAPPGTASAVPVVPVTPITASAGGPAPGGPGLGGPTVRTTWGWPLSPPPAVLHRFEVGPQPWSPGHRGVDLAATAGRPVLAPADGVVAFAGVVAGRGVLVVDHPGGLRSSFEPVSGWLPAGSAVRRGDRVALLGPPGLSHCAPAACLHWGVRRGEQYLDPLALLGLLPPIVLLPLG
jgi:murein DD-endopeptidase MepM/ murein hydrolase activator NlpD